ncbi:MAG: hypothetical protein IIC60_13830, partial [Proteobacteria bacterium]|nr:hypothetical protein [Pseudomonadota bacterium]
MQLSFHKLIFAGPSLFIAASFPPQILAQDTVADDTTIMYPASYFVDFAPTTAKDMLDRIPGAGSTTGGGSPSFGGGGFSGSGGGRGGRG